MIEKSLFHFFQLNLKVEIGFWGDRPAWRALLSVSELIGYGELALASHLHAGNSLRPSLDQSALFQFEGDRLTAHIRIELFPILEGASIKNGDFAAQLGFDPFAHHHVLNHESIRASFLQGILFVFGSYTFGWKNRD